MIDISSINNKIVVLLLAVILLMLASPSNTLAQELSTAGGQEFISTTGMQVLENSMARSVDESTGDVITRGYYFYSTDSEAYSWLSLGNVGAGIVEWRWYSPDGNLYDRSSYKIPMPNGTYWNNYKVWDYLSIAGYNAANLPGKWHVDVYLNGQQIITEQFTIETGEISSSTAGGQVIDVGPGARYSKIQDAIDAANSGDTIRVKSGTYSENINVDKRIFLLGWNTGGGDPIVDAGNRGSAITFSAGSNGTDLEGFKIRNSNDAGIKVNSNDNYIGFVSASNNKYGILLKSASNCSVVASIFSNNDYGIYLDSSNDSPEIWRNTAMNNNYGIYLISSSNNDIQGNDLRSNRINDAYDTDITESNSWSSNRYSKYYSPYNITGGSSVDYSPENKKPTIPDIRGRRHR